MVSADPGCGKSVLAKHLFDNQLGLRNGREFGSYFFFKDQLQNTLYVALAALSHQLLSKKHDMVKNLMPFFEKDGKEVSSNVWALSQALQNVLYDPEMEQVTFIIDALDECQHNDMKKLLDWIAGITSGAQGARHKFILTSRPYTGIITAFDHTESYSCVHIPGNEKAEEISEEVNLVIKYRCKELYSKEQINEKVRNKLLDLLLSQTHNTYLYVYLVFEYLEKQNRRK